jgi:hypothetical protein
MPCYSADPLTPSILKHLSGVADTFFHAALSYFQFIVFTNPGDESNKCIAAIPVSRYFPQYNSFAASFKTCELGARFF